MNFESVVENGQCKASADGELTIYVANDLKDKVNECVSSANSISLDLSKVEEIDTTCVQLLLQTKQACDSAEKSFAITEISPAVQDVLNLCGLANYFGETLQVSNQ